jgi:ABC-2 type transport system permease protein/sodium transport system permease protein
MNLLAAERFLPSAFLGLILGWVCWRTGSVVPGMVLHVCHNGLLLMLSYYQKDLAERGWGIQEQSHMPVTWLVAAGIALVAGLTTIWFGGKSQGDELVTMDGRQSGPDL